jgi:hypothetical protein
MTGAGQRMLTLAVRLICWQSGPRFRAGLRPERAPLCAQPTMFEGRGTADLCLGRYGSRLEALAGGVNVAGLRLQPVRNTLAAGRTSARQHVLRQQCERSHP